jgi:hypothetical protein
MDKSFNRLLKNKSQNQCSLLWSPGAPADDWLPLPDALLLAVSADGTGPLGGPPAAAGAPEPSSAQLGAFTSTQFIHCKIRLAIFPSPARMSLSKLLLVESLAVTSQLETGKSLTFFTV